ncbi:MAG: LysM peptidoglycan-binding domain-containing protein [Bacteroidota bacterium]
MNKQFTHIRKTIGTAFSKPVALFVFAGLFLIGISAEAQQVLPIPPVSGSPEEQGYLFEDTIKARVIITSEKDTLLEITETPGDTVPVIDTIDLKTFKPNLSMDLLERRLKKIEKDIPLVCNKKVAGFVDFFTVRKRNYTQTMLERQDYYFPMFEKCLAKYGLPNELKYLAVVESGLNHAAVSRTNAVGLWQFMGPTARDHGLKCDFYIDDRMDPERSTEAACRYLKTLYRVFGDWELVLASYNCGLGKVKNIMKRTGHRKFWDMYDYLPQETRAYVPQFTAVCYAMNYATEHGIFPDPDSAMYAIEYDTITVNDYIHLPSLAKHLGVPYGHLRQLNPALRRHTTPHNNPYLLCLPTHVRDFFADNKLALMDSVGRRLEEAEAEMQVVMRRRSKPAAPSLVYHKVRRGENLFRIAEKYGMTAADLRSINHIKGNSVKVGRRLVIKSSAPQLIPLVVQNSQTAYAPVKAVKAARTHKAKKYIVQKGDTLWAITQKHEGLTVEELIRLNNLKNRKIKAGQKLIVG